MDSTDFEGHGFMTVRDSLSAAANFAASYLINADETLTTEFIQSSVDELRPFLSRRFNLSEADYTQIVRILETRFSTTMGTGFSLTDPNQPHDEEWYSERENWAYWNDYSKYLQDIEGLPLPVITSIDSVTDKILGLLQNPEDEGEWDRRGLVIGHVQSGKTANYIGLIAKAADAGYRFIIVIAGIHNNLRTQTQERIDAGFIGRDSETRQLIGVGEVNPSRSMPTTVTTKSSDFNKALGRRFNVELKSLMGTFIIVIKKNVSTLRSLYEWLSQVNVSTGAGKITDIPMLLIDDEADNASVNTNREDVDPTRINREIRRILSLFRKSSFVGYTATPFANIFIDPDDEDDEFGKDLFPEHFIYCLDAPSNYFGADKLFRSDESESPFIRIIDDAQPLIPLQHKKDLRIDELPGTLKRAILTFILARAIRNIRGQSSAHCSMMINVSRFVDVQRDLSNLVRMYVNGLAGAVRLSYALPPEKALKDSTMAQFYEVFRSEFESDQNQWSEVQRNLNQAASSIKILVINNNSDEILDYAAYSKEGNGLTAIVIGGLSLSRGLTIEGLTVSYMYRNTQMYDTLMQMGRWFGYRNNYEDLCRVYLSADSFRWYSHIAEATEELRLQVKQMRRDRKKPSDFGLYVRAHPDTLLVTARNKMRKTETRDLIVSYDGKLRETHIIPESVEKNQANTVLFREFVSFLRTQRNPIHDEMSSLFFSDIRWNEVYQLLSQFRFHDDLFDLKENVHRFVQEISDLYPKWDVSLKSLAHERAHEDLPMTPQRRRIGYVAPGVPKTPLSEHGWFTGDKNRFSGNSMFAAGLSEQQLDKAQENALFAGRNKPLFRDYTNARNKPLLICHMLNLVDSDDVPVASPVPALSVSFPNSSKFKAVEYVLGPVMLRQLELFGSDTSVEEDDYDPAI